MKIGFCTIAVKNLQESVQFYTEVLNLVEITRFSPQKGLNIVFLKDEEGNKIELIEYPGATQKEEESAGNVSIGVISENLEETMQMLEVKNIQIVRGPIQTPGGNASLL